MSRSSEVTKNDQAWEVLFERHHVLDNIELDGYFMITAAQINAVREARLMTKFDHRSNLPQLFASKSLAILPITRGSYIIAPMVAYHDFEPFGSAITKMAFPDYLESIDYAKITSEAGAIHCAYLANIFADFLEDEALQPTVSGRMSSEAFSFMIHHSDSSSHLTIQVANSQLEIDGGYEGAKKLAIVEAKNFLADDFLIRQLYYPYRLWHSKVSKRVIPVFLVYSNGIFNLYEYAFQTLNHYNSLQLVKQKSYSIEDVQLTLDAIINVFKRVEPIVEPKIAFPQADSFERVINLCELLAQNEMDKESLTLNYAFNERQTNYYTDAARYLDLVEKATQEGKLIYQLSAAGQSMIRLKYQARQLKFVEAILRHKVFYRTFEHYLINGQLPSREGIIALMKEANLYKVTAESTYYRRAATIISWVNWMIGLPQKG